MATILKFMGRGLANGDWTVAERAQLREMSAALTGDRTGSNLVFGTTEDGDPWVVATDDNEDVVLHIARIGGRVIIHRMFDGMVREAPDVYTAATLIQQRPPARVGRVQPILADALPTDAPFTLIAGAALHDNPSDATPVHAEMAPRFEPVHSDAHQPIAGLLGDDLPIPTLEDAPLHVFAAPAAPHAPLQPTAEIIQLQAYLPSSTGLAAVSAPLPDFAAPQPAVIPVVAQTPDEQVDGETVGGGGEPPISPPTIGAEGNGSGSDKGADTQTYFEGGAGADVIIMGDRVVAFGGDGADTFIVNWRKQGDDAAASRSAGVILDYNEAQGDRLVFANDANPPQIVSVEFANLSGFNPAASFVGAAIAGRRIGFDLDGDGREDVHILFGGDSEVSFTRLAANVREPVTNVASPMADGDFIMGIAAAVSPAELFI
ncbi:hypothetical protein P7B02_08530 [Caulobacter segnis]|uniref:hypothetical protein n=1 Tax=Caulobacter segnis TaxID=88688 RepID=UPI00240EAE3C|nr:hypothetical protein [Caulobacter segnis]MDG2521586.1 hypothetical protein [Caulobacter segnis]